MGVNEGKSWGYRNQMAYSEGAEHGKGMGKKE